MCGKCKFTTMDHNSIRCHFATIVPIGFQTKMKVIEVEFFRKRVQTREGSSSFHFWVGFCHWWDIPYISAILRYSMNHWNIQYQRIIGTELAHSRHCHDTTCCPFFLISPDFFHLLLGTDIIIKVCAHAEVVSVCEGMDNKRRLVLCNNVSLHQIVKYFLDAWGNPFGSR